MRVLLVDHDSEGLEAVARAIRGVLELDCVTSKGDAMLLLRQNAYDVLIACERCVDGSGLDLLGRTTRTTTPLKRIFAAPPDRLQLLGPRLAPFKVQRTISYPIDLEELWLAIAQVTGTHDDTDGTIERVVLDERGIPSSEAASRAAASGAARAPTQAPRPPAPVRDLRPAPQAAVAAPMATATAAARSAVAARMPQAAPEPPPRAPAPVRPAVQRVAATSPAAPARTSDTGRMRALAATAPPPVREELSWTPEPAEDFAQVAEQARLGVQRKVIDEAARRKKQRLITACAIAVAVAGVLVFLIEQFYDPEARAREKAIAAEVSRMAEQQKVTDNLTLIEVDIEKAIMDNDLDLARQELAKLVRQAPQHPRREFLQASIDRAAELARLAALRASGADVSGSARTERPSRTEERAPAREPEAARTVARERVAERTTPSTAERTSRPASNGTRAFGAPIGETPGQRTIPLNAPINAEPILAPQRSGSSFGGRTVEASDSAVSNPLTTPTSFVSPASSAAAGSAAMPIPPAAAATTPAPAPVDVTPAKIVKRVAPVPPFSNAARNGGFVVVKYNVTEAGRVTDVEVVESSPSGVFDGAAQAAVRKWLYEPRKENGQPVTSSARARLVFEPAD